MNWRWDDGQLACHDPETGEHIAAFDSESSARLVAEARADAAEARIRELKAELRRRDSDS